MKTIHIRVLRRTRDENEWKPLEENGNDIQEVPVRDNETPETTDCVEFMKDTIEGYRIHPGDAVMIQQMSAEESRDHVPTMWYTHTLKWWKGHQVIEATDALGRLYIGTRGAGPHSERYVLVRTTAEQIADFNNGEVHLRPILTEGPSETRYTVIGQPTNIGDVLTVVKFEGDINEPGFLPAPGATVPKI